MSTFGSICPSRSPRHCAISVAHETTLPEMVAATCHCRLDEVRHIATTRSPTADPVLATSKQPRHGSYTISIGHAFRDLCFAFENETTLVIAIAKEILSKVQACARNHFVTGNFARSSTIDVYGIDVFYICQVPIAAKIWNCFQQTIDTNSALRSQVRFFRVIDRVHKTR